MPLGSPTRRNILFAFALAVLLFAAWSIRSTLLLIYVSIVFAIVFTPAVSWITRLHLGRHHLSTGAAVLVLLAAALLVIVGFGFLIVPGISNDMRNLTGELPQRIMHFQLEIDQLPFGQHLAKHFNPGVLESKLGAVVKGVLGSISAVASAITTLLLLVITVAYFIVDGRRSFHWALSLFPPSGRDRLQQTLQQAAARMQKWLIGQALLMLILGCSSLLTFWALGIPYFYALAFFAGVANFVPIFGPIATVVVAGLVAATVSWTKLLGVIIFYVVYQQVENSYLTPRIMQSSVQLPAVAVIVALSIGGALAGIAGAIVAVPSAALIATLLNEYLAQPISEDRRLGIRSV